MISDTSAAKTADVAARAAHVAPTPPRPVTRTPKAKTASQARRAATAAKRTGKSAASRKARRSGKNRSALILSLVGRPKGATMSELVKATRWRQDSIRGFLSLAHSKRGLKIELVRNAAGERAYRNVEKRRKK